MDTVGSMSLSPAGAGPPAPPRTALAAPQPPARPPAAPAAPLAAAASAPVPQAVAPVAVGGATLLPLTVQRDQLRPPAPPVMTGEQMSALLRAVLTGVTTGP